MGFRHLPELTAPEPQRILSGPERDPPAAFTRRHFLQLATPKSHFKRAEHRIRWCAAFVALMRCDGLESASKKIEGRREKS